MYNKLAERPESNHETTSLLNKPIIFLEYPRSSLQTPSLWLSTWLLRFDPQPPLPPLYADIGNGRYAPLLRRISVLGA